MSSPPISYYLSLLTSEYQNAPRLLAWLQALLTVTDDINACRESFQAAFDIDQAIGVQLDVLGQLVGVGRTLPFQPSGSQQIVGIALNHGGIGYHIGDILSIDQGGLATGARVKVLSLALGSHVLGFALVASGQNYSPATGVPSSETAGGGGAGATFDITSVSAGISSTLDDDTYRILLKAKIAQNQWDGQITSLYAIWQTLFPGGTIAVQDNQNMTATIFLSGITSSIVQDMIVNGLIVPRPEGVLYNYVTSPLPAFGFDGDHVYIAGFDEGHWA